MEEIQESGFIYISLTGAALVVRLVRFGPDHFLNFLTLIATSYKSL